MSALLLDRYEVLEEAGSGGFASVVVAWDTRIQRKVAIKCMPLSGAPLAELMHNEASPQSILLQNADSDNNASLDTGAIPGLEEARMAAMLNDASIVSVYDFEIQENTAYLILEYIEGITLGELLARYPENITSDVIAAVFKAVSHALEIAHKNKVLHLDIKPDNVLIDKQGNVKVVDFGLARLAGEYGFGTATGGTIGYMPPEQMRQESLDERCDEWALASLTYEMISGDNPFLAPTLEQAEKAIEGAELFVPSMYLDEADESIDDIMFCALDPDKQNRYDSVADFAHEMKQCLGDARKGKRQLARVVGSLDEDEEDCEEESFERGSRWSRGISLGAKRILVRVWSALAVGFSAFVGLVNASFIPEGWASPASWIILVLALVVGGLCPSVGFLLALIFVGVVLCFHELYLVGIVLIVAALAWFALSGRRSVSESLGVLSVPLLGSVGLVAIVPLLAGVQLKLKNALVVTLFAAVFSFILAGFGSGSLLGWDVVSCLQIQSSERFNATLVSVLQNASTWLLLAAWFVSAAVMVVCSFKKLAWFQCVGVVLSVVFNLVALGAGELIATAGLSFMPASVNVLSVMLSGVGMILYVLFIQNAKTVDVQDA